MLKKLVSRKLAGSVVAIAAISGLVIGTAVIVPSVVTTELVGGAVAAIAGLGGYQVTRQARVDETEVFAD